MPWSRRFEDPITLPSGKPLVTLRDAGRYIEALPAKMQSEPHWRTATEELIAAAEGRGPLMHARIGMLRALNHGKPKPEVVRSKATKKFRIVR